MLSTETCKFSCQIRGDPISDSRRVANTDALLEVSDTEYDDDPYYY